MIDCDWAEPRLSAWFDGELEPAEARTVMAHVERCAVCERRRRLLVLSSTALRTLGRAEEHASPAEIAAPRVPRRSRAAWLVAAAALLAIGIGALSLHVSRSRPAIANQCGHCGPETFPAPARDSDVAQKR